MKAQGSPRVGLAPFLTLTHITSSMSVEGHPSSGLVHGHDEGRVLNGSV